MTETNHLRTAMTAAGFLARHTLALALMVAVPCLLWTVAYAAMLLQAMITNGDPGGRLLYPSGLLMIFTGVLGFGLCVCFPITAVAEWVSHRRGWPLMLQYPVSLAMLLLMMGGTGIVMALQPDAPWHIFPATVGVGFLVTVAPFTIYWGLAQSFPIMCAAFRWLRRSLKLPPFPDYPRRPSEDGTRSFKALQ